MTETGGREGGKCVGGGGGGGGGAAFPLLCYTSRCGHVAVAHRVRTRKPRSSPAGNKDVRLFWYVVGHVKFLMSLRVSFYGLAGILLFS